MKLKAKITGMKVPYIIRPGLKFTCSLYENGEYTVAFVDNKGQIIMGNGGIWSNEKAFHDAYKKGLITIIN